MKPKRRRLILILVAAAVVLLPLGGYAVFALQTGNAPPPARLRPAPVAASGPPGPIDGAWAVSPTKQDFVGYRVREKLGPLPAPDDAVGRTRVVRGQVRISGQTITAAAIVADLSSLRSDASPRDGVLRHEGLETDRFPSARFTLTNPVALGDVRRGSVIKQR